MQVVRGVDRWSRKLAVAVSGEFAVLGRGLARIGPTARHSLVTIVILGGLWTWLGWCNPQAVFASPLETAEALYWMLADRHGEYVRAIGDTIIVFYSGFFAALVCGAVLVMAMGLMPPLARTLSPLLDLLGSVPNIAFMPMLVALLGLGHLPKMTVVFIAAILPIVINGYAALRGVRTSYEEAAISLGARRIQAHLFVLWPIASASMVAGLRIGAIQGLAACVVAEIYTAMTGLGGLLVGYGNAFRMPRYFVVVLTLALLGLLTTTILRRIERARARHVRFA